jgi:hypothetical protein
MAVTGTFGRRLSTDIFRKYSVNPGAVVDASVVVKVRLPWKNLIYPTGWKGVG